MKKIKFKIIYLLILAFTSVLLTQCKSFEFTFLGFFSKKYSKVKEKPIAVATNNKMELNLTIDTLARVSNKLTGTENILMKETNAEITMSGIVTDTANKPINGADIYITNNNQIVSYAFTDKNGRYCITKFFPPVSMDIFLQTTDTTANKIIAEEDSTIRHDIDEIHSNEYKVLVKANGFKNIESSIIINPKDSVQLDFILKKMSSISGKVIMINKNPVFGAIVLIKSNDGILSVAETNQDGEFQIEQLENGTYTISILHNKYTFPAKKIDLQNGDDCKGMEIISNAGEISGFIKNSETNNPIQQAIITMQNMRISDYTLEQSIYLSDTSGTDGSYKIEGLDSGNYKIQVNAVGYGSLIEETELNDNKMQKIKDFAMTAEGLISGQLANYNPDDTIVFIVIDNKGNGYISHDIEIMEDGKYVLKGLTPGIYKIVLKWKNMLIPNDSIIVISGRETQNSNFTLKEATCYISGRIFSKTNNEPVENSMVIAMSESSVNYTLSDKNGNYRITRLSPGSYKLFVNVRNYEIAKKYILLNENDKVVETIDFKLMLKNKN